MERSANTLGTKKQQCSYKHDMTTLRFIILLFSILSSVTLSYCQSNTYYAGFGILQSDIHGSILERERQLVFNRIANLPKTGYHFSLGILRKIWKPINLDLSINYQERWPLENFRFGAPDLGQGVGSGLVIEKVPTSPQSDFWDPNVYKRLPNFKYTHLEIVPYVTFGKKLEFSAGIGLFYGILLNQNKLLFDVDDFPAFDYFFDLPSSSYSVIRYHKSDIGWIPKIRITYQLDSQIKVGFSAKAYISEYSLSANVNEYDSWWRQYSSTWKVFTLGFDFLYSFNPKD